MLKYKMQQSQIPQWFRNLQGVMSDTSLELLWRSMTPDEKNTHPENPNRQEGGKRRISKVKRTKRKNKKEGASKKKNIVPYANEIEEAAYFLSLNNKSKKNKNNKRTVKTKRNKRSRTKKNRRTKRTKKNRITKRNTRKTRKRQRGGI